MPLNYVLIDGLYIVMLQTNDSVTFLVSELGSPEPIFKFF
jgi:hypothetical protein